MCNQSAYTVEGMTCGGCAGKVSEAIEGLAGVVGTDVDLATGILTVTGEADGTAVREAIANAGYQVASPPTA